MVEYFKINLFIYVCFLVADIGSKLCFTKSFFSLAVSKAILEFLSIFRTFLSLIFKWNSSKHKRIWKSKSLFETIGYGFIFLRWRVKGICYHFARRARNSRARYARNRKPMNSSTMLTTSIVKSSYKEILFKWWFNQDRSSQRRVKVILIRLSKHTAYNDIILPHL